MKCIYFSVWKLKRIFFPLCLWKLLKVVGEKILNSLVFFRMNIKQTMSTGGLLLGAHSHPELGFHDFITRGSPEAP